ncbi:DNA-directed RNA polymerase [Aeromonas phage ZPAH34]|uniref:DNA-directed RNA polymerase n=1 Tax=Aeromonas phage ZPAH34 TaxID=2924888 RepID=UPI00232922A9|nr:DNA-directed RNA polymerase [Aeromonas phage ZPAH34]UOX39650.1 DNA-directed RNA polymerase [Aeromonas phage ZPAH34]
MYCIMLPDLISRIQAYSSFGHHQMLDPNRLFKTSRFATATKTNLLNMNALFLDEPIQED